MTIKKFLHSCLLVEENGKRLLIDPGNFSFVENKIKPTDIGAVDVIVITHKHRDHCYPPAIKELLQIKSATIFANEEIGNLLKTEGLSSEKIKAGETKTISGFTIEAIDAPHGPTPGEPPHNLAFLINKKFLVTGDSLSLKTIPKCDVLALPAIGSWMLTVDALNLAKSVKPKFVFPVHDGMIKEFYTSHTDKMWKELLEKEGITFKPLALGEFLEI